MTPLAACTIISKNYLAFARVLARSFLEHHPEGRFFVLLVDRGEGRIDPQTEPFTLLEIEELENVPELRAFLFKYTLLELNTAIKPFFMEHLLERHELPNLVYFDPDILITGSLDELAGLVDEHSIVLTPHLTHPIEDDAHPGELAILQAGAHNLGFIALRHTEVARRLLGWWQKRLYEHCVVRIDQALFVDQKWVDLVPGIFRDVHLITHPGYNVAYWNLHGREVTVGSDGPRCNGQPLVFFHFSGVQPESLEQVSKHQDRFTLADIGEAAELYRRYSELVIAAGYHEARPWPYAFARFDNGAAIPELARALYLDLSPGERRRFGDPFAAAGDDSFFAWLNQPHAGRTRRPPYPSRLVAHLYAAREDLRRAYPDGLGGDFPELRAWLLEYGRYELKLDDTFVEILRGGAEDERWSAAGLRRRLKNRLKRLYISAPVQAAKRGAKSLLGASRFQRLKQRLRPAPPAAVPGAVPRPAVQRYPRPTVLEPPGVNLVGYLSAETGMGEAARSLARAFATTSVPTSLTDLDLGVVARRDDTTIQTTADGYPYAVNLFVVNADQLPIVHQHLGGEVFGGRVNVGLWLWELATFPDAFRGAFDLLHEVWTPSTFCADAISAASPLPVRRVPLPVTPPAAACDRARFGIPEDAFVFLFMFNFLSYFERKNPLALIEAFRRAFRPGDGALLVLKTSQSDFAPEAKQQIEAAAEGLDVLLIDEYSSREEIASLTALCDAYVSLHRSEGFGLTLAEAMACGKPVIATPYSGNADFFDLNNGYPVRYDLVPLAESTGPYPAGAVWAQPDAGHAAELMRRVFENAGSPDPRAERARRDVHRHLSAAAVGRVLEQRFAEIVRQASRGVPKLPLP